MFMKNLNLFSFSKRLNDFINLEAAFWRSLYLIQNDEKVLHINWCCIYVENKWKNF